MKYILAADDEPTNLLIIEEALMDDYEVETVVDGVECLNSIKNRRPDLLLVDVAMPNMDGIEVCQNIRSEEELKNIPIIMLSGFASKEDIERGLEAGADDYFTKPFEPSVLREIVKKYLDN